eukprot:6213949-Pleurochrysis_carterae.AAC.3
MVRADRRYQYSTSHSNVVRQKYFRALRTPGVCQQRREIPVRARPGRSQPVAGSRRRTEAKGRPGCCPRRGNPRAGRTPEDGVRGMDKTSTLATAPPTSDRSVAD